MYDSDPFWTLFLSAFLFGVTATIVVCGLWEAWRAVRRQVAAIRQARAVVRVVFPSPNAPQSGSISSLGSWRVRQ